MVLCFLKNLCVLHTHTHTKPQLRQKQNMTTHTHTHTRTHAHTHHNYNNNKMWPHTYTHTHFSCRSCSILLEGSSAVCEFSRRGQRREVGAHGPLRANTVKLPQAYMYAHTHMRTCMHRSAQFCLKVILLSVNFPEEDEGEKLTFHPKCGAHAAVINNQRTAHRPKWVSL